jgi:hypothetical protein
MQAQIRTGDRWIIQFGQSLGERPGSIIVELTPQQEADIRAAASQLTGGIMLSDQGDIVIISAPAPAILNQDRGRLEADAHTTGATSAELFRATLPTLSQFNVSIQASGIAADNGAQRTVWVLAVVQRLNGGASVIGQVVAGNIPTATGNPVPLAAFAITASGNDVVITVTGLAAREIDWILSGEYVRIRPSGLP